MQRILLIGLTHLSWLSAHLIDFGHGKLFNAFKTESFKTSLMSFKSFLTLAKKNSPLGVSFLNKSLISRPQDLAKPSTAFSLAFTEGPFLSSTNCSSFLGKPSMNKTNLLGVTLCSTVLKSIPSFFKLSQISFSKSSEACFCILAGISSEKISTKNSLIRLLPRLFSSIKYNILLPTLSLFRYMKRVQ
ncbi:MAG: hypothetical protein BWY78_00397 [Alphaproteobacteria bacterium ADurb.Bin438]|nr:MAG: hypothetical protein BWY78_00397 [Alphaproteobacteria bacterium ADurb.Bin438]